MSIITKKKFVENYNKGVPQILSDEFIADIETPISTLLKITKNEKYSFLLESVEGGEQRGRFSLLGCKPDLIWKVIKGKVETEASGGITADNLVKYAETGVDYISMGALTHSVKSLDLSLKAKF